VAVSIISRIKNAIVCWRNINLLSAQNIAVRAREPPIKLATRLKMRALAMAYVRQVTPTSARTGITTGHAANVARSRFQSLAHKLLRYTQRQNGNGSLAAPSLEAVA
jgi:hypothetical protein